MYEALTTLEVLGIGTKSDVKTSTCKSVVDTLSSPTSTLKDLFFGLRVNRLLKCEHSDGDFTGITTRIKDSVKEASSLLDFYYSIGSLIHIKVQTSEVDVNLEDADRVFRSIKALSQSDGRWRYSSNNSESSTYAAGLALETLGGVASLASSGIDEYLMMGPTTLTKSFSMVAVTRVLFLPPHQLFMGSQLLQLPHPQA